MVGKEFKGFHLTMCDNLSSSGDNCCQIVAVSSCLLFCLIWLARNFYPPLGPQTVNLCHRTLRLSVRKGNVWFYWMGGGCHVFTLEVEVGKGLRKVRPWFKLGCLPPCLTQNFTSSLVSDDSSIWCHVPMAKKKGGGILEEIVLNLKTKLEIGP